MSDDILNQLKSYSEIIHDKNCLKIVYYLFRFNPDIPTEEIRDQLGIEEVTINDCIDKLLSTGIIFKNPETGAYTMTPSGRNAFKKLIDSE